MPPDTGSDDYVDQRTAELRQQLYAICEELDELDAIRRGEKPPPQRRRFTIIQGGAAALVAVISGIGALAAYRPRHPVAVGGALTAAGVTALVIAVPTYGAPPPALLAVAPPSTPGVSAPASPSAAVGSPQGAPVPSASPSRQPWTPSAIPVVPVADVTVSQPAPSGSGSAFPSASVPAPSASLPGTPGPSPSPASCLITVSVPGVIGLCVL